jgi:hypothetical protein
MWKHGALLQKRHLALVDSSSRELERGVNVGRR